MKNGSRGFVILGAPRSGTSCTAGIFAKAGCYLGEKNDVHGSVASVKKIRGSGYPKLEYRPLLKATEDILIAHQLGFKGLYINGAVNVNDDETKKLSDILVNSFNVELWATKSTRGVPLFSALNQALSRCGSKIKYVLIFREPGEVLESLRRRDGVTMGTARNVWNQYAKLLLWIHGKTDDSYAFNFSSPNFPESIKNFLSDENLDASGADYYIKGKARRYSSIGDEANALYEKLNGITYDQVMQAKK